MNVTDVQFAKAFEVFQDRRQPALVEDHWRVVVPDIDPQEFTTLQAQCEEVIVLAVELWYQVYEKRLSEDEASRRFTEKYAYIPSELLRRTWVQAAYDAAT